MISRTPAFNPAWSAMALLAVLVAAYAAALLLAPGVRNSFVSNLFSVSPGAIVAHLAGGLVALVAGAFQVNAALRARYLRLHRLFGRIYVVAVLVGGSAGLVLAFESFGGLVANWGFGMLGVLWIVSTLVAFRHIRARNVAAHRAWILRSYALALAAVTLRIYLPLSGAAGIEFKAAYQAIAWLCWVPNLVIVEWFVLARTPPRA